MSRGVGTVWKLNFYSRNTPPNVEGREAWVPVLAEQPTSVRQSEAVTSPLSLADGVLWLPRTWYDSSHPYPPIGGSLPAGNPTVEQLKWGPNPRRMSASDASRSPSDRGKKAAGYPCCERRARTRIARRGCVGGKGAEKPADRLTAFPSRAKYLVDRIYIQGHSPLVSSCAGCWPPQNSSLDSPPGSCHWSSRIPVSRAAG